jgi:outer membrane protein assembly factor BamB
MILVGATVREGDETADNRQTVLYALDALTGTKIWDTAPQKQDLLPDSSNTTANMTDPLFPITRGTSSAARRRSNIVNWRQSGSNADNNLPNCLLAFRHDLLSPNVALPFAYWGNADARSMLMHLDRNNAHPHHHHRLAKKHEQQKVKEKHNNKQPTKKRSSKKHHKPVYGRPNTIVTHSQDGIHVRSLKNGRALCHLSLLDKVLYADLNRDGSLDSVHVITDHIQDVSQHDNEWISGLARQIESEEERKTHRPRRLIRTNRLCHVLGLSGTPAKEEMFAANLCGGGAFAKERGDHVTLALEPAPPLVVDETDVVVALNNGMVRRYHAPTGRNQWSRNLEATPDFPRWLANSTAAYLTSLDVASAAPRPILMSGANSMMLLSPGRGKVMAHALFPQSAIARPYLADVSGDGTADVMIQSADAIFGYQVVVHAGTSILFRVLVGLLLMGMALALLRNRFASRNGADKRSTDA